MIVFLPGYSLTLGVYLYATLPHFGLFEGKNLKPYKILKLFKILHRNIGLRKQTGKVDLIIFGRKSFVFRVAGCSATL